MNLQPIYAPSITVPNIEKLQETKNLNSPFPEEIQNRLTTLNLLAQRIIGDSAPLFSKIIEAFNRPEAQLSFIECEDLFEEAFIKEFSSDEIHGFLECFFEKFNQESHVLNLEKLNESAEKFLWEGIIRFYCKHYVGFENKAPSLFELFSNLQHKFGCEEKIVDLPDNDQEAFLQHNFDLAMDVIPLFSGDEQVQLKLMLISYSASLISALKVVQETQNPNLILENEYTLKDLFEDIYCLLLEVPFMPSLDIDHSSLRLLDLENMEPRSLKDTFISNLIIYLLDPSDEEYIKKAEIIKGVISDCSFLNFEYRGFLQNILRDTLPSKKR